MADASDILYNYCFTLIVVSQCLKICFKNLIFSKFVTLQNEMRFSQTNLSSKKTLDRLDRDVFEAKLWLKRTCRRGAHQNRAIAPSRCDPTSSIVYSCCNRAPGIFPHSYGNVLGLIERNQLGFGIYLLQVSVLQWKNQLATLNHIVVPMTSISHLIEPKTYYDRAPQT